MCIVRAGVLRICGYSVEPVMRANCCLEPFLQMKLMYCWMKFRVVCFLPYFRNTIIFSFIIHLILLEISSGYIEMTSSTLWIPITCGVFAFFASIGMGT